MRIHLIRHGEVHNPHDMVYADIPDFRLSTLGQSQATAAGEYLATHQVRVIVSSPLDRAVETSQHIARATGAEIVTDPRLTEWKLAMRWRGASWRELPRVYPGELEAYLESPERLPFSPEQISEVADRMSAAVDEWTAAASGDIAFVSHQDPIHAAHLRLIGSRPDRFNENKPQHCTVLTLQPDSTHWRTTAAWHPPQ